MAMIDFEHIGDFSGPYHIYNLYLRLFHNHFYYHHRYLVNANNIPEDGKPLLVIANHQNGVNDAMNILYMFADRRQPVFIARGDIFKKEFVAKILRFLKILPTFRSRDGDRKDIRFNMTTFDIAAKILNDGGTIVIFPEAQHQQGHYIGSFKKGFPRVAFGAEEKADFKLGLKVLPVNIHYQDYYSSRTNVVLTIGEPFGLEDFIEEYKTEPNQAYAKFNDFARARLKSITPDVEWYSDYYSEIDLLRLMWTDARMKELGLKVNYLPNRQPFEVKVVEEIVKMRNVEEERFMHLMDITHRYQEELKKLNLRDWVIGKHMNLLKIIGWTLTYIIMMPIIIFGLINNIIPFEIPALLRRKIKDRQLHSSFNYVVGVIAYTIYYILTFVVAWIVFKSFAFAICYLVATILSFFVFYNFKRGLLKYIARWRYWLGRFKGKTAEAQRLKKKIVEMSK